MCQSISHCLSLSKVPGSCEPSLRWVHSQQVGSSTSLLTNTSVWLNRLLSPNVKRATRKLHVTLSEARFLHALPPRQTPSSFGCSSSCEQARGRPLKITSHSNNKEAGPGPRFQNITQQQQKNVAGQMVNFTFFELWVIVLLTHRQQYNEFKLQSWSSWSCRCHNTTKIPILIGDNLDGTPLNCQCEL